MFLGLCYSCFCCFTSYRKRQLDIKRLNGSILDRAVTCGSIVLSFSLMEGDGKIKEQAHPTNPTNTVSVISHEACIVTIKNESTMTIQLYWVDEHGSRLPYSTLHPHDAHEQNTYVGHVWIAKETSPTGAATEEAREVLFVAAAGNTTVLIDAHLNIFSATPTLLSSSNLPNTDTDTREPPYQGTVWYTNKPYDDSSPTALTALSPKGCGIRNMFDRRNESFNDVEAHLFDALLGTSKTIEVHVNPEFTSEEAGVEAAKYMHAIGMLPAYLLKYVRTVWIHKGNYGFGGGNDNLLIHTERGEEYIRDKVLTECFVHESTHTSVDANHASADGWVAAQQADPTFISSYARDNPTREDLAECMGPYLACKYREDKLPHDQVRVTRSIIGNRIKYLDTLGITMDICD